jgi:hypothetical protein
MATWFTVIGPYIAQIEGIFNSGYKNALVEFEDGNSKISSCRCFYVVFWCDLLESGRSYVIFGTGHLTGNEDYSQPKVRGLTSLMIIPLRPRVHSSTVQFGIGF